jgi:hypothetical protein
MRPHESPNCDCPACSSHDFQEAEHAFPNLYPLPEHDDPFLISFLPWEELRWAELAKLMGKS